MSQPQDNRSAIRNTTADMRDDPAERLLLLATGMATGGPGEFIEAQERSGQAQLVNSDRLPTDTSNTDADFVAVGFTFGNPDPTDDLFRPATLPPAWKREPTDHSMWSKIVDQHGRERASIFYKAAFYDRRAFMRLTTPHGYLSSLLYDGGKPVLDEVWLTADVAREELALIANEAEKRAREAETFAAGDRQQYWTERAAEHRKEAAKARKMAGTLR